MNILLGKKIKKYLLYILILLMGISAGYVIRSEAVHNVRPEVQVLTLNENSFRFTRPLLDFTLSPEAPENEQLNTFRTKLDKLIKTELGKTWADGISVYYRDLNYGRWFTLGKTEEFYPASLLKVPLMVAVLKEAESHPEILKKKIRYSETALKKIQNDITNKLEPGRSYTVEELLERMIIYSDNVPTNLLERSVNPVVLDRTYTALGIADPYRMSNNSGYMISAEAYASYFRILYNSTYLNQEMSEKALGLLTETDFQDGLIAGVPPKVPVAHKWGFWKNKDDSREQLHDCGIVFYPGDPYILCVMTSGKTYDHLDDAIREISRMVYEEVDHEVARLNAYSTLD